MTLFYLSIRKTAWVAVLMAICMCTACSSFTNIKSLPSPREALNQILGGSVSSNLEDAYPSAKWLSDLDETMKPTKTSTLELKPGYYRLKLESYCLRAGAHGPVPEEGHLLAPIQEGRKAEITRSVLLRASEHPNIPQCDIQRLLWSIEAGISFGEMPENVQKKVMPLLSPRELLAMGVNYTDLAYSAAEMFLPEKIKEALTYYEGLRQKLLDVQGSFEQLEEAAVLSGLISRGAGSQEVSVGTWSYVGDGFFARSKPLDYKTTIVDVYRPYPTEFRKDAKGRINLIENAACKISIKYHDDPGYVRGPNGQTGKYWLFKSIRVQLMDSKEAFTIRDKGWIVARQEKEIERATAESGYLQSDSILLASADDTILCDLGINFSEKTKRKYSGPDWKTYTTRFDKAKSWLDKVSEFRKELDRPAGPGAVNALGERKHVDDGLKALNPMDMQGKTEWLAKHFIRLSKAWEYVNNTLHSLYIDVFEDSSGKNIEEGRKARRFDPTRHVSAPGNTNRQPLGLSARLAR